MLNARRGMMALAALEAAAAFALDAHSFTDVNAAADPWTTPAHTFDPAANLIIARAAWENNVSLSSVVADPGGDDVGLGELLAAAVSGGLTRVAIWAVYSASPLGLDGETDVDLDFSGGAAGSVAISSYIGASKLPTTFDVDTHTTELSLANSIAIAGGEEGGHILSVATVNGAQGMTPGGGLAEQHENQGAAGGQTIAFAHLVGPLSNPEAPSYGVAATNGRFAHASVLVV